MDIQRLFLFLIFSFSLVLVWDGWQRYQHPEQYIQPSANVEEKLISTTPAFLPSSKESAQATIVQRPAEVLLGKIIHIKSNFINLIMKQNS